MNFSKKYFIETKEISHLLKKIDSIDKQYIDTITDEIYQSQPFLLSLLLGYQHDLELNVVDEIMKVYFIIWEYFKDKKNVRIKKITKEQFENSEKKNIDFFNYLEKSEGKDKDYAIASDLEHQQSKALLTAIFYRFNTRPVLVAMNDYHKGIIIIGVKSIMDCFEAIGKK